MDGVGELIVENKIVIELKGELTKAYKTIAEKEAEFKRTMEEKEAEFQRALEEKKAEFQRVLKEKEGEIQRLLEKNAVEKRHLKSEGDVGDTEPEVKSLERKAEEIIPKDCWGVVFRNLDAEDLLSCRQVCKSFNQLLDLREFKEKWEFKRILPLLFPYLETSDPDSDSDSDSDSDHPWKHLFNARLVCRSWRYWIDQYVSEVHGTQGFLPRPGRMPVLTRFRSFEDMEKFQRKFGKYNTNPFPSRSVYIFKRFEDEEIDDYYRQTQRQAQYGYYQKVGELLEQFGKHIFRLEFWFTDELQLGPDPLTLCKLLKRTTIHLPNLRKLIIRVIRGHGQPNKVENEEVASYIAENALAALPNLRVLCISDLDKKVEEYLLDAFGSQLTQLETSSSSSKNLSPLQMQQFKNVRKLWLEIDEPGDILEILRYLESPLNLLKLTCEFGPAVDRWNVDKFLRNLKHLPTQILEIHLRIWGRGRANFAESGIDREEYNNASIKTLIIHNHQYHANGGHISFNFLQALSKLENLELKFSGAQHPTTHPEEVLEVVELNEYLFEEEETDLPYHSNVWEKVPSLKTLTLARGMGEWDEFDKSIYTREKYQRIIEEGDGPERN